MLKYMTSAHFKYIFFKKKKGLKKKNQPKLHSGSVKRKGLLHMKKIDIVINLFWALKDILHFFHRTVDGGKYLQYNPIQNTYFLVYSIDDMDEVLAI